MPNVSFGLGSLISRGTTRSGVLLLATAGAMMATGYAQGAGGIVDLGKPMAVQSPNQYFPLGGFHRVGSTVRQRHQPALLFIGTQADPLSGMERWPVIKALDQFGTLSGVAAATSSPQLGYVSPVVPTFDWSHAHYKSKYIAFVHTDLLDTNLHPFQRLSSEERALYYRYSRAKKSQFHESADHVRATIFSPPNSPRKLPLITVGGYLQTLSQLVVSTDFGQTVTVGPTSPNGPNLSRIVPYSFDTIRTALVQQHDPPQSALVEHVNAEANIITALVCRADGLQPSNVCNRSVIKSILKHVR